MRERKHVEDVDNEVVINTRKKKCSLNQRKQVWLYYIKIEVPNASTFPRVDCSQSAIWELKRQVDVKEMY